MSATLSQDNSIGSVDSFGDMLPSDPTLSFVPLDRSRPRESLPSVAALASIGVWTLAADGDGTETRAGATNPGSAPIGSSASVTGTAPRGPMYELQRRVAVGGMGEIWEATQNSLERTIAVKRIRTDRGSPSDLPYRVDQFRQEALISARLQHPNIVPVHDLGLDEDGLPVLAMKLVKGRPWDRILTADCSELDEEAFIGRHIPILIDVAQALAFAHSQGIVHRDVKPAQVMVGEFGEVLLMDWGLGVFCGVDGREVDEAGRRLDFVRMGIATRRTASNPSGTPAMMAPEQTTKSADGIGHWTDIYLLGGTLYFLLTLTYPHQAPTAEIALARASEGKIELPSVRAPSRRIPEELEALALRCLQFYPKDRPGTVLEFIQALQDYLNGATKRRESKAITTELKTLFFKGKENHAYRIYAEWLSRLGQAMLLWPGNPEAPELRSGLLEEYATAALANGDLTLAEAQAAQLPEGALRVGLLNRIHAESQRRARIRRNLRVAIGATILLLGAIIVIGFFSLREIERRNIEIKSQHSVIAEQLETTELERQRAVAAEQEANEQRDRTREELAYSTIQLCNNLLTQERGREVEGLLWEMPEPSRSWEWGWLMKKAAPALYSVPERMLDWRPAKGEALTVDHDGTLWIANPFTDRKISRVDDIGPGNPRAQFDPTGRFVFFWDESLLGRILDRQTNMVTNTRPALTAATQSIAFHPERPEMLIGGMDGAVISWKLAPFEPLGSYRAHGYHDLPDAAASLGAASIRNIGYLPGDRFFAMSEHSLRIHDLASGEILFDYWRPEGAFTLKQAVLSPNQEQLLLVDRDAGAMLVRLDDYSLERLPYLGNTGAWSPDGRHVLVLHESLPGGLWDVEMAAPAEVQPPKDLFSTEITWTPDGTQVLLRTAKGLEQFRITDWSLRNVFPRGPSPAWCLGFDSEFPLLWINAGDRTEFHALNHTHEGPVFNGHTPSFTSDKRSVVGLLWTAAEIADAETGMPLFHGAWNYNLYRGVTLSADGARVMTSGMKSGKFMVEIAEARSSKLLITRQWDIPSVPKAHQSDEDFSYLLLLREIGPRAEWWSIEHQELLREFLLKDDNFVNVMLLGGMNAIIGATVDGNLILWDLESGERLREVQSHTAPILSWRINGAQRQVITGDSDGRIVVHHLDDFSVLREFQLPVSPVDGLVLSPDGKLLMAVLRNETAHLLDLENGKGISIIHSPGFPMHGAQFLDNNRRIFAGTYNVYEALDRVRIWDTRTGRELTSFEDNFAAVNADGTRLLLARSELMADQVLVAPWRSDLLPGDAAEPFHERYLQWKRDQLIAWAYRQGVASLPRNLRRLRLFSWQSIDDGASLVMPEVLALLNDTVSHDEIRNLHRDILDTFGRVYAAKVGEHHYPFFVWQISRLLPRMIEADRAHTMESPGGLAIVHVGLTIGSQFHSKRFAYRDMHDSLGPDGLIPSAELLVIAGEEEISRSVLRRQVAFNMLRGIVHERAMEMFSEMGGMQPPPPPAELVFLRGRVPPFIEQRMLAGERDREQAERDYVEAANAWLDEVAPWKDFSPVIERYAELLRPYAVPREDRIGDHLEPVLERYERHLLRGLPLAEREAQLRQMMRQRLDLSGQVD